MKYITIRVDSPEKGEPYNVYIPANIMGSFAPSTFQTISNAYRIGQTNVDTSYNSGVNFWLKILSTHPSRPTDMQTREWLHEMFSAAWSPGAPRYGQPIPFDFPIEAITYWSDANVPYTPPSSKSATK